MALKLILNGKPKSGCFIPHEPIDMSNEAMPWE